MSDQEQRETASMEESNAMTIEFLRARLLSERSVSKTARQRADELAKRVAELEDQLKFVSLQRKKAEKATVDVLAILENRGISDVSEEFDSISDPDESPCDFRDRNGSAMTEETSTNTRLKNSNSDAYSSSEIESSPSISRSLSWKSTKDSESALEKKKYMDSTRRRTSFVSSSSSARRAGKSCRRIRRREMRSVEDLENDGTEKATRSIDGSNCSDGGPVENPTLGSTGGTQETGARYFGRREGGGDMETALQHQAQLIGQYEEEEKAQREWEDKFRENTQDSCDPGNHSDVTEERYDVKSDNPEMKQEPDPTSKNLTTLTTDHADKGSSTSEFSFPMSKVKSDQGLSSSSFSSSDNLGSVLEALHRAKSSLTRKLNYNSPASNVITASNPQTNKVDNFNFPAVSPGLFRLPTDTFETTTTHQPNLEEFAPNRFLSEPLLESGRGFSRELFLSSLDRPFSTHDIRPGLHPTTNNLDPYADPSLPLIRPYQFVPDITFLQSPLNDEGSSRTFDRLPPSTRFTAYDENVLYRSNLHR